MEEGQSETPRCPACSNAEGRACVVSVGAGYRTITYKCPSCTHTWTITLPEIELQPHSA
jgi:transposase-like protein